MALIVARVWRVNAAAIVRSIPFVVNGRREPSAGECRSDFSYGKHCFPWVHRRRTRRRSSAVGVPLVIAHQSTGTVSLSAKNLFSGDGTRHTVAPSPERDRALSLYREGTVRNPARGPVALGAWPPFVLERDSPSACSLPYSKIHRKYEASPPERAVATQRHRRHRHCRQRRHRRRRRAASPIAIVYARSFLPCPAQKKRSARAASLTDAIFTSRGVHTYIRIYTYTYRRLKMW